MGTKSISMWLAVCTCAAALATMSCAKATSTAPSSPSDPAAPTTPTPTPASTATVTITINPNPVPFSGAPITDTPQCANYANTWFYDQVLLEYGGTDVKFTNKVDMFDDKVANNLTGLDISIGAHGSLIQHTRWCSGAGIAHTAQTQYTGVDAKGNVVTVIGPVAHLNAPGK
jgi:hypothetical protein